ncbi:MAG: hypothetical protein J6V68_04400 [Clostridia bacterium]|nr:hypothetical protein [Clostridia bacterium]
MEETKTQKIYVLLTHTGTILSKMVQKRTGGEFNHASLSFDDSLTKMYSFSRVNPYIAFIGAFMKEAYNQGTFKRFKKTKACLLEYSVSESSYSKIKSCVEKMYDERKKYGYAYKGLFSAGKGKVYRKENCFYCSEFVWSVLENGGVLDKRVGKEVIMPMDFLEKTDGKIIYKGQLSIYKKEEKNENTKENF